MIINMKSFTSSVVYNSRIARNHPSPSCPIDWYITEYNIGGDHRNCMINNHAGIAGLFAACAVLIRKP